MRGNEGGRARRERVGSWGRTEERARGGEGGWWRGDERGEQGGRGITSVVILCWTVGTVTMCRFPCRLPEHEL